VRLGLPVQITYDSDVEMALKLLADVARTEPRVLQAPNGPEGYVVRFADNGIDLELGLWINDPENGQLNLKSALNRGIWKKFREHGIKISSPQREFRLIARAPHPPSTPAATRGRGRSFRVRVR
jgi:small-conductance mechanosensitive channel